MPDDPAPGIPGASGSLPASPAGGAPGGDAPSIAGTVLAVAAAAAALLAFCRMYSTFPWYDDDGYLLVTLRSFLDGHPLYDETYSNYGPCYYLWRFLLHGLLGIPLTHDATRLVALFEWGLCGLLAALIVRRATGDGLAGGAGGLLAFLFLEPVTREPSHPQLLAMAITLAAILAFTTPNGGRVSRLVAGLLVGALFAVKPNLGAFAGLGFALVLARSTGAAPALAAVGAAAVALPLVLLRPGFREPTIVAYAAISGLAALALVLDRRRPAGARSEPVGAVAGRGAVLLLGAAAAVALSAAFAMARGTTVKGLLEGLVWRPMALASAVIGPKPFPPTMAVGAAAAVAAALAAGRHPRAGRLAERVGPFLGLGWTVFIVVAFAFTAVAPIESGGQTRAFAPLLLGLATPWAFLLRPAGGTAPESGPRASTRETLVALAVTHLAIGFPSAGTQLACAGSLLLLAAFSSAREALEAFPARRAAREFLPVLPLLAVLVPAWAALNAYRTLRPLSLPGAAWLRVNAGLAEQFRATTEALRENGGPFVTVYGLNSLYLWTGLAPPTPANATLWPVMLSDAEQSAIVAVLERDERSVVLVATGAAYLRDDARRDVLGRWILERTVSWKEIGPARWELRRLSRRKVP